MFCYLRFLQHEAYSFHIFEKGLYSFPKYNSILFLLLKIKKQAQLNSNAKVT